MENRKLCLLIPSLQAGGMERVMSELAWYFSRKISLELHIVLFGITREVFYKVPEKAIIHEPSFRFRNSLRMIYSLRTLLYLRSSVKSISPSAILSFGEYWNSFVLIALLRLKYPIFISDRCQPDKHLGIVHNFLRRILYPAATGFIAQTEKARDIYFNKFLNNNIRVIGNPIRTIQLISSIQKENIILTVGRLISTKHHDRLIKVFLNIEDTGWKLVIVGYDHLKQNNSEILRKIIAENCAEERVILEGKQADVESYYLKSRIFAFMSSSEGFPNVIGEAMSAGLPVVAYDCSAGPSEMIRDSRNGFLVPLYNDGLFKEKLQLLMENEELRNNLGSQAKKDISRFSIESVGEQFIKFMKIET